MWRGSGSRGPILRSVRTCIRSKLSRSATARWWNITANWRMHDHRCSHLEHRRARRRALELPAQAARQPGLLVASLFAGFAVGIAYRFLFDPAVERDLINFVRSGLQGAGVALAVLAVQIGFASGAQYRLGSTLRRLPVP